MAFGFRFRFGSTIVECLAASLLLAAAARAQDLEVGCRRNSTNSTY
jgi:hypothetical protein